MRNKFLLLSSILLTLFSCKKETINIVKNASYMESSFCVDTNVKQIDKFEWRIHTYPKIPRILIHSDQYILNDSKIYRYDNVINYIITDKKDTIVIDNKTYNRLKNKSKVTKYTDVLGNQYISID